LSPGLAPAQSSASVPGNLLEVSIIILKYPLAVRFEWSIQFGVIGSARC
jgi:hypothetical protein